ncbi:glycosyltransferase [Altererythrobacter sp. CC-YST694]|uniref:glycosyltransferase n=1 Tax=Altererythrobacter sp. CC-YST694 TaxID=2755038 RepID=UPI001D00AD3B|nr:glycosyltransferase [Altererythrobacter sp. CC-YST694]MCB5425831.1 glycosyltransferase [Altererythrobacter sp. CC-YST694]
MSGPRIGLLTTSASRAAGGVFEAIVAHCETLRGLGFTPVIIALDQAEGGEDHRRLGDTEIVIVRRAAPRSIAYAPALVQALLDARLDLLHLHGIWMYPSHAASSWAARTGKPYVISPHGMLDPWIVSRGKLKKSIAMLAYERASWRRASCFHALTIDEANDIRAITGRDDSEIIPNAVELAGGEEHRAPRALYLGRIHPKKNIGALIEGWRRARPVLQPLGARLEIAGWGAEEDVAQLREQIAADDLGDIAFLGPQFGPEKTALIGAARFLALPSHSEGLPMAIIEAWAQGTPTLMSRHCHLPEGYDAGAAMDCGTDPDEIAISLKEAFGQSQQEWQAMSQAASDLVRARFTPAVVAQRWGQTYSRLLGIAEPQDADWRSSLVGA